PVLSELGLGDRPADRSTRHDRLGDRPLVDRVHAVLEQRSNLTNSFLHTVAIGSGPSTVEFATALVASRSMQIPRAIYDEMIEHVPEGGAEERCGIIASRDDVAV